MRHCLLFVLVLVGFYSSAQSPFRLILTPKVGGTGFAMNEVVENEAGIKMEIEHFDYYLSRLHIIHDGGQDLDLSDTVFLIKPDDFTLNLGVLNVTDVEKVSFGVGVPIELSHTDITLYPDHHPLSFQDPSMQWGWAAGYMHMIVGGMADSDGNDVPDAYFEIHNLGDNNYHEIEIPVYEVNGEDQVKSIYLDCNLDEWLGTSDLANNGIQHGETGVNYLVMKNVILRPVFTATANAGLKDLSKTGELLFYRNNGGNFLKWSGLIGVESFRMVDMSGKAIRESNMKQVNGELNLGDLKPGTYFIQCFDQQQILLNDLKIAL